MRGFLIAAMLALTAFAGQAQTYPDYREVYVNDFADLLDAEREDRVRDMLIEVKDRAGIEFTVVTISRMSDFDWNGEIEPFATGLFNQWGVGDAEENDGVMLLDPQLPVEAGDEQH
ncbi:MAG: TPM domain-containing protein, partial [Pseudomonadota bacterium]